jgi:hypothetical protein
MKFPALVEELLGWFLQNEPLHLMRGDFGAAAAAVNEQVILWVGTPCGVFRGVTYVMSLTYLGGLLRKVFLVNLL